MTAYYNEIDLYAAEWLQNLIAAGHIAPGEVDTRSIVDVQPSDLIGFTQCHFFAGIGGWSLAARLAGWTDNRPLWTGSCPCQPFSVAGKGEGQADERHLWPVFFDLIRACRPDVVMGEQVAAAVGKDWLDGVSFDLESIGYACGAAVVPACAVDAPHRRDRLWFVADAEGQRGGAGLRKGGAERNGFEPRNGRGNEHVADAYRERGHEGQQAAAAARHGHSSVATGRDAMGHAIGSGLERQSGYGHNSGEPGWIDAQPSGSTAATSGGAWGGGGWIIGADAKARRVKPGLRLLAHGVPARVGRLRAYGNAIVPQVAAEVIGAYMECRP